MLEQIIKQSRQPLEVEVYELLEKEGIELLPYYYVTSGDDCQNLCAKLDKSKKYVAKVMSPKILHKSDFNAVRLNVSPYDIPELFDELSQQFHRLSFAGLLIIPMADDGVEFLIGSTTDPTFGLISVFGIGGTMVELIHDVTFGRSPLNKQTAMMMINELETQEIYQGPRGLPRTDKIELSEFLIKVSHIAMKYKNLIREIDLNPVRVTKRGIFPLDARIIFHPDTC